MQKLITSKALSLFMTLLLAFGVFAGIEIATPKAYADTIEDGAGNQLEISFATNGTTATSHGITATLDYSVDLSGTGWGFNLETEEGEIAERLSFFTRFTGNADADGALKITLYGEAGRWGIIRHTTWVYVKAGQPIINSIDNGMYDHYTLDSIEAIGGKITNIAVQLDFEPMDTYALDIASADYIELEGVYFEFWTGNAIGGYCAANEDVGINIWAGGTPTRAGVYTINAFSAEAGVNVTRTINFNSKLGQEIASESILQGNVENENYFIMPAKDVSFTFTVTFTPSGGGESTSKSSNGGSGDGSSTPSTPAPAPVNTTTAVQDVKNAVASAKNSHDGASVRLQNVTAVSLNTLKEMAKAAGGTSLKINADSLKPDGSVDVRITLDPAQATSGLNLAASTTSAQAQNTQLKFAKYFDNTVSTVSLSQKGSFGMPIRVAAKVDAKLSLEKLVFYSYDSATNKYAKIENPQYKVDKNGFVHFTTSVGGDIIISDKPLAKK